MLVPGNHDRGRSGWPAASAASSAANTALAHAAERPPCRRRGAAANNRWRWPCCRRASSRSLSCGSEKRSSPRSRIGLKTTMRAPRIGRLAQIAQHARMIGAGVLPDNEDRVCLLEILQRHRALANADRLAQARRRSPRGTCSSSRGNCWCRRGARRAGRGRPLRCWRGPRYRIRPGSG